MRPSPVHSQSKCESSQNSSQGCYLENNISRKVFENRKSLNLWVGLHLRRILSQSVLFENGIRSYDANGLRRLLDINRLVKHRLTVLTVGPAIAGAIFR